MDSRPKVADMTYKFLWKLTMFGTEIRCCQVFNKNHQSQMFRCSDVQMFRCSDFQMFSVRCHSAKRNWGSCRNLESGNNPQLNSKKMKFLIISRYEPSHKKQVINDDDMSQEIVERF